jgi:hypothetical protein
MKATPKSNRQIVEEASEWFVDFRVGDVYLCTHCGGTLRHIAVIRDPIVIRKIIEHTTQKQSEPPPARKHAGNYVGWREGEMIR